MADTTKKWWACTKDERASAIHRYVGSVEQHQLWIRYYAELHERLYTNRHDDNSGTSAGYAQLLGYDVPQSNENYLAAVVDTYVALIGSNRPKPTAQTSGAHFKAVRTAKKLDKYLEGKFDTLKVYDTIHDMVLGSAVHGMGVCKVFIEQDEIAIDHVQMDDIVVDEREARNCPPQQIHHRRFIDKDTLKGLFPGFADVIETAPPDDSRVGRRRRISPDANSIPVLESWRLPSSPGASDGMYVVSIKSQVLLEQRYKKDYFPFVFLYHKKPVRGFYGQGIAEAIAHLQLDHNREDAWIKECQNLMIAPRVYGDFGAKLPEEAMSNEPGLYVNTKGGKPPTFYTPQALNAETYNWHERRIEKMFKIVGISEMIANARKEPGLDAGVAIREVNDIQSGRFAPQSQWLSDAAMEIAKRIVWCTQDLKAAGKPVKAEYKERNVIKTIDWADIDIGDENFDITIEAASLLGNTPAGRLAKGMDMLKLGIIDVQGLRNLIDHPDVDRELDLENAPRTDIEAAMENLMDGKYEQPDPVSQDLVLGLKLMRDQLRILTRQEAPEEILQLFRDWIAGAEHWSNPPPPPAPPAMPGAPMPGAAPIVQAPIAPAPPLPSAIPGGN
jgi:hypothetical protein